MNSRGKKKVEGGRDDAVVKCSFVNHIVKLVKRDGIAMPPLADGKGVEHPEVDLLHHGVADGRS